MVLINDWIFYVAIISYVSILYILPCFVYYIIIRRNEKQLIKFLSFLGFLILYIITNYQHGDINCIVFQAIQAQIIIIELCLFLPANTEIEHFSFTMVVSIMSISLNILITGYSRIKRGQFSVTALGYYTVIIIAMYASLPFIEYHNYQLQFIHMNGFTKIKLSLQLFLMILRMLILVQFKLFNWKDKNAKKFFETIPKEAPDFEQFANDDQIVIRYNQDQANFRS